MTSEQLVHLQGLGSLVLLIGLALGALQLVVGLIQPGWVWRKGLGSVVLVSLALWFVGFAAWGGIIAYTHSHPNGPHSAVGYINDYFAEQCAQGADLPACKRDATPAATPAGGSSN